MRLYCGGGIGVEVLEWRYWSGGIGGEGRGGVDGWMDGEEERVREGRGEREREDENEDEDEDDLGGGLGLGLG